MSLQFDGTSGCMLKRKSGTSVPSMTTLTVATWLYISTDKNDYTAIWYAHEDATDSQWLSIDLQADGTTIAIDRTAGATTGTNLTVGKWYHVCLTKSGSAHILYVNGNVDATVTDSGSVASIDSFYWSSAEDAAGNNFAGFTLNGRLAAAKIWSGVAFTQDEIRAEMRQMAPRRMAGLWAFYPMRVQPEETLDFSPGRHPLTTEGTRTTAAGPPIPWEVTRPRIWKAPAAAAGTGSGMLLGGVRNYLVREAY